MQVSVIIVNYNTRQLLNNCLSSIYKNTSGVSFEVIVVDNASIDESRQMLESEFGGVITVFSESNLGFGKANNLGATFAKGDYLFLLNSDTLLKNNAIKIFYDFMICNEKRLSVGAVGCQMVDGLGNESHSYGFFPSITSEIKYLSQKIGLSSKIEKNKKKIEFFPVEFVSGADLFINKNVFAESEGFDPNFFMYYEETDLQKRLKGKGYNHFIISDPYIVHFEGGSADKTYKISPNTLFFAQASLNYYMRKHFNWINYFLFRFFNICEVLAFLPSRGLSRKENIKYLKILFFR